MKYFVCYTIRDKEITFSLLQHYANFLKISGDVYIDLINNNSLDKQKRVFQELDQCDVLIIIETKNVYNSKWVELEINRALELKKEIVKISVKSILEKISNSNTFC
ncbi:TIR domain-containing protein [Flavobacterium sp. ov086]|uniref:TIR domain-containing protein n=1 Tax=Flavobacterium sp. ov086 TaxID=1761785 RepID=UPI000B6B9C4A|nr:TIR domain-containing protein [Flavobacterium sp. ov086]SNR83379.1 MTH538 TIR-like domain [Flavobacterium sp. ov086]